MNDHVIIAVDFDGTIFEDAFPEIGKPIPAVIDWLKASKRNGAKLILWTCRCGEYLSRAISACLDVGLRFDAVNENLPETIERFGGDCRKIVADIYVDDKGLTPADIERNWKRTISQFDWYDTEKYQIDP